MSHRTATLIKLLPTLLLVSCPAIILTACGGGGGGGGSDSSDGGGGGGTQDAITELSYPIDAILYILGVQIESNTPSVTGPVDTWTVSPELPKGMFFHAGNGRISGTPSELSARSTYIVTAANSTSSLSYDVSIGIEMAPALALTVRESDGQLSSFSVDSGSGAMTYHDMFAGQAGDTPSGEIVLHPAGSLVYRLRSIGARLDGGVLVNTIDPESSRIGQTLEAITLPASPLVMAFHPNGDYAYIVYARPQRIGTLVDVEMRAYEVDQDTGALAAFGATRILGQGDEAATVAALIIVDPLGEMVYATHIASQNMNLLPIMANGALSADIGPQVLNGSASDLAMDSQGRMLFVTIEDVRLLLGFVVDRDTGAFETLIRVRSLNGSPSAVAVHPIDRFVYVALRNKDKFLRYDIDTTSTVLGQEPVETECVNSPRDFVFDASGHFAFLVSAAEREIWSYGIDQSSGDATVLGKIRTAPGQTRIVLSKSLFAPDRRARFAYALNAGDESISSYELDATSGEPSELASPVLAGDAPLDLAGDPRGRFLYTISDDTSSTYTDYVAAYPCDSSSGLLDAPLLSVTGKNPRSVTTHPHGRYVFVTTDSDDALSFNRIIMYELDSDTGALTLKAVRVIAGSPQGNDIEPGVVRVDPTGQFVYVLSKTLIASFVLDMSHANPLIPSSDLGGSDSTVTGDPVALTFSADGRRAYVVLRNLDFLVAYDINKTHGQLTNPQVYSTDSGAGSASSPQNLAIHPNGLWAFVANSEHGPDGSIDTLIIDAESGQLSLADQATLGLKPFALGLDPQGRYLYAANSDGGDLSHFSIDVQDGSLNLETTRATGVGPMDIVLMPARQ